MQSYTQIFFVMGDPAATSNAVSILVDNLKVIALGNLAEFFFFGRPRGRNGKKRWNSVSI